MISNEPVKAENLLTPLTNSLPLDLKTGATNAAEHSSITMHLSKSS